MKGQNSSARATVTPALAAEAAAWLAILHGPDRTAATERGFSEWLKSSPAHALAFEQITEIWEESRQLRRDRNAGHAPRSSSVFRPLLALAAGVVLAMLGVLLYAHFSGVSTAVGEQRALTLKDGTRVVMNTDTRLLIAYDQKQRRVELKRGEALFEVAKRPDWPFVVTAGAQQVTALGTTFAVRRQEQQLAVTLVEGRVVVTPIGVSAAASRAAHKSSEPSRLETQSPVVLTPGQRVIVAANHAVTVDQPELQRVLAWQRREVALDDTPLLEAVTEMNRYSFVPLVVSPAVANELHVTGLFRAGDSLSFARAVAKAYRLEVVEHPDRIVLRQTQR